MTSLYLQQTSSGIKNHHWNSAVKEKKYVVVEKKIGGKKTV